MDSESRLAGRLIKAPENFLDPAGVRQVFVTLRDSWPSEFIGEYQSEGLVSLGQRYPYSYRRKPAFANIASLNGRWRRGERLIAARRKQLRAARKARKAGKRRKARRHYKLARRYAKRWKNLGEY